MSNLFDDARRFVSDLTGVSGRQAYFFEVPGTESAVALSVVSVMAVERLGYPTEVRVVLTHPLQLARTDYLNRDAVCTIVPDDGVPHRFSGFIARFSTLQTTADFTKYEIVLKSHFARLEAVSTSRIYQHQTTPQIIEAVLRSHGLEGHQFAFRLRREYPKHLFRFQYKLDDLSYVRMLIQKAGIYSYIVETEHGDQVVFADDVDHYQWDPHLTAAYRETAGLEATGAEAVTALKTHTVTVPQSFAVADYNPEQAWERFKDEANVAPQDPTTYGQPYVYGTNHLDQDGAKWEAQLRHEAAIAWQVVYEGESNVLALQAGRVLNLDTVLPDAPDGQVVIEVTHRGARDRAYSNSYIAIPANRRFRLKLEEEHWPKIAGTLSARVTSPDKYKYAYLTAAGYYTVRFDVDFADWPAGGESVPLRLAKPFAGKLQTGFHFPALDNDEAVIAFRDADPDKPEIIGFHHHSQARDLVTSDRRWLSRNVIRTQSNNKLRMDDWAGQEGIKLSTEHSGTSHLDLGYLVNQRLEYRGEGFELRTSGYGAIRAGKGLLVSADDQPDAEGKQLDMKAASTQLKEALQLMRSLEKAARSAQAQVNAVEQQRQLLAERLDRLQRAVLLATAPEGVAVTSGDHLQLSAKTNLTATAIENVDIGAGKNVSLSAANAVSIFAQNEGVKVVAAKNDIQAIAHSGQVLMTSAKDMKLVSVEGELHAFSRNAVVISSGGAYIKLSGGNIELGCPGSIIFKRAGTFAQGPASLHESYPPLANSGPNSRKFVLHYDGHPDDVIKGQRYRIHKENGAVIEGVSNDSGETSVAQSEIAEVVRIELLGKDKS
ncbi:type VI secretion system Vgr family protein [Burkholderia vietnamiensis]|uniref:type VI secretion system Vgr family protein n=1 Tax=Burkholderia vietnamiensis TaxID=60552 RepID=UPI00264A87AD|nr:type VI secretion system Vgr family protein [Burkholderia vietnamiensis]MDN7820327.1 type VI secretion system tip protein VgrG [Burkholderia vietnamiensis]